MLRLFLPEDGGYEVNNDSLKSKKEDSLESKGKNLSKIIFK